MRIYLIGMPGSGKTTIGKKLAENLKYDFIDLDAYIEEKSLMFIEDIFKDYGEDKFRELETKALSEVKPLNIVISTGGGIVTKKKNKLLMDGLVIYLNTDLKLIEKRLEDSYLRPLLKNNSLENIYNDRFLKYQDFANYNVSNNKTPDDTLNDILKIINEDK